MNIYLLKNGQNTGPYSESDVVARIKSGAYAKTDLAWCEGCIGAVPLIEILCRPSTAGKIPATDGFSAAELAVIAENSTKLLIVAACWLVACLLPLPTSAEGFCFLAILGFWLRFGWRLSQGLRQNPWIWVAWTFIPIGSLYALVRILWTAARTLKSNGVSVGILGADRKALARLTHRERLQARV